MFHLSPLAAGRQWLAPLLLVLPIAAQLGCDDRSATGRPAPRQNALTTAASSSAGPAKTGSGVTAEGNHSASSQPQPSTTSSAGAAPPASPPTGSVRCSAAQHEGSMFFGRLMGFKAGVAEVDGLGLLVRGTTTADKYQLRRIPKNPPTEPKLKEEPAHEILVDGAERIVVNDESIYYLEPQQSFPFRSRLLYLPTSVEDAKPTVLAKEATHIVGEWEGWLYFLKMKDEFNGEDLSPIESRVVRSTREYLDTGYRWRFRYELLRVKKDGTTETIGESPRNVDRYYRGHVYGRILDWGKKSLAVFRTPVKSGKQEILYQRKWARGRGGVPDTIGKLAIDADGVFFYDGHEGVVRRLDHAGGATEDVVRRLAFGISLDVMDDYLFIDQRPRLKKGGTITWRNDEDSLFGEGKSGSSQIYSSLREGPFQFVAGRRHAEGHFYGDTWGFVYEHLPGGVINARRFKLKPGHMLLGPGVDEDCLYYTRTDWYNTWFYAMPRPSAR